jgi:branched-chain amino acid transport system substrate-binding protein
MQRTLRLLAAAAALGLASQGASAQNTVKIANIVELSGAGATSGTNFRNGIELAVKEINAAGGILGRQASR